MSTTGNTLNHPADSAPSGALMKGCLVAIAGPSGAGKDTLIRGVQERLLNDRRFVFARRIITREGDCSEEHDTATPEEFAQLLEENAFLLSWAANGLSYGLPAGLASELQQGHIVVANISRAVLPEVRERFQNHLVVHVTAKPEVLAKRLAARGREDVASQQARIARAIQQDAGVQADVTIDNSADLDKSLLSLEQTLKALVDMPAEGSLSSHG
ncbi:MAG: phosphonate metabolism protein/1,5-bisphosphokinase (PRPP-forming) PhnN [Beijerinckiaceae bacterium]